MSITHLIKVEDGKEKGCCLVLLKEDEIAILTCPKTPFFADRIVHLESKQYLEVFEQLRQGKMPSLVENTLTAVESNYWPIGISCKSKKTAVSTCEFLKSGSNLPFFYVERMGNWDICLNQEIRLCKEGEVWDG